MVRAKARLAPTKSRGDVLDFQKTAQMDALVHRSLCLQALTSTDEIWRLSWSRAMCMEIKLFGSVCSKTIFPLE